MRTDVKQDVVGAFVQDDISLVPSQLHATIGSKIEYNNFSGFDIEPSARLIWTPNDKNSLWAAVSRAARTPTIAEEYVVYFKGVTPNPVNPRFPPIAFMITGNRNFELEEVMTDELGYRVEPLDNVSLHSRDLLQRRYEPTWRRDYASQNLVPTPVPHIVQNVIMGNFASARTYGWELAGEWQPTQGMAVARHVCLLERKRRSEWLQPGDNEFGRLGASAT